MAIPRILFGTCTPPPEPRNLFGACTPPPEPRNLFGTCTPPPEPRNLFGACTPPPGGPLHGLDHNTLFQNSPPKGPPPLQKKGRPFQGIPLELFPCSPSQHEASSTDAAGCPFLEKQLTLLDPTKTDPRFTGIVQRHFSSLSKGSSNMTPASGGTSGAFLMGMKGATHPNAIIKCAFTEIGSKYNRKVLGGEKRDLPGIQSGEGAFSEYLAKIVATTWLEQAGIRESNLFLPNALFCKIADEALFTAREIPGFQGEPYSTGSQACILEFFQGKVFSVKELSEAYSNDPAIKEKLLSWGANSWQELLPIEALQMVAIMDLCLLNQDRNKENLLLHLGKNGSWQLIPIDHGAILPREDLGQIGPLNLCWMEFPQIQKEEPVSESLKQFVENSLSSKTLQDELERLGTLGVGDAQSFAKERVQLHIIAVTLVKEGVRQGLSLYQLGKLFTKDFPLSNENRTAPTIIWDQLQSSPNLNIEDSCKDLIRYYKQQKKS